MSFNARCCVMFRQGLWHLMELSRKPIFIIFQSQQKQMSQDISHQLRQHQPRITTLTWGAHSMVRPSQCSIHLRDLSERLNESNHSYSLPTDPFFRLLEGAGTGIAAQGDVSQGICRRSADSAAGRWRSHAHAAARLPGLQTGPRSRRRPGYETCFFSLSSFSFIPTIWTTLPLKG